MDYIEVKVIITPYDETTAEILIAELGEAGCDSFSETENGFDAYIQKSIFNKEDIDNAIQNSGFADKVNYTITTVKTENWNALWESNFEPVVIDTRCTIRAPFHHNLPKTELDIVIEPKMAFGTGHHETTYLMSEATLDSDVNGLQVLDMGCGTGILAIIAALRGAKHVVAIDNDDWATDNAIENIKINGLVDKISVATGDANLLKPQQYNLILANINRNILLNDMERYVQSLLPNGTLIMSGIYEEDIPMIDKEASRLGLKKRKQKTRNKWAMVEFA